MTHSEFANSGSVTNKIVLEQNISFVASIPAQKCTKTVTRRLIKPQKIRNWFFSPNFQLFLHTRKQTCWLLFLLLIWACTYWIQPQSLHCYATVKRVHSLTGAGGWCASFDRGHDGTPASLLAWLGTKTNRPRICWHLRPPLVSSQPLTGLASCDAIS